MKALIKNIEFSGTVNEMSEFAIRVSTGTTIPAPFAKVHQELKAVKRQYKIRTRRGKWWKPTEKEQLTRLIQAGKSVKTIAKELGRTRAAINGKVFEMKLKRN